MQLRHRSGCEQLVHLGAIHTPGEERVLRSFSALQAGEVQRKQAADRATPALPSSLHQRHSHLLDELLLALPNRLRALQRPLQAQILPPQLLALQPKFLQLQVPRPQLTCDTSQLVRSRENGDFYRKEKRTGAAL
eukprot:scaffold923_cov256-Pinguiococcus_pyrenoidosus.AAC.47